MNSYSTRYASLSDEEVNELYQYELWKSLSNSERFEALQELENRTAFECGNHPCEIFLEEMNGAQYRYYYDGRIYINQSLVYNGEFHVEFDDGTNMSYTVLDSNSQLMDTIHHENYHAYQREAIDGIDLHNNQGELELWKANDENYTSEYPFYRIQSIEATAFDRCELKTQAAFELIEKKYGEDRGYQEYLSRICESGYDEALCEAKELTGVDNIQQVYNDELLSLYADNQMRDNIGNQFDESMMIFDGGLYDDNFEKL